MRKGVIYRVPFGTEVGSDIVNDLKAKINGTSLNPSAVAPTEAAGTIVVNARNGNNVLLLSFPSAITVGSYSYTTGGMYRASYSSAGSNADAISGTLDISIVNKNKAQYSNIFSFQTGPPGNVSVSEGSFTISL
jgi:hypothetical protein